jgi:hypothetical protein
VKIFILKKDDIYAKGDDGDCSSAHWETLGVYSTKEIAEAEKVKYCEKWGEHTHRLDIDVQELDKLIYYFS